MEAIIFIGIQASGKSTFYHKQFMNTHIRISLDLLNTRNKEDKFLETCFATQSKFVIDNTNPTVNERLKYIELAKKNKYKIIGYYFQSKLDEAISRNNQRAEKARIKEIGLKNCYSKLQTPSYNEGFDELFYVSFVKNGFQIKNWENEI